MRHWGDAPNGHSVVHCGTGRDLSGNHLVEPHNMAELVELDSRRRAALGRIGNPDHTRYLVEEEPDGSLLFTPAVVMTAHEEALLRSPDLVARIENDLADPSRLVESQSRRPRQHNISPS